MKPLYKPESDSRGEDNGQVVIIGGSTLFHGAPLLSLKVASRIVDMVFFASPEPSLSHVAERLKSELLSFIWVPWEEVEHYLEKADAALIGPGFLRFASEKAPHGAREHLCDAACQTTKKVTESLLTNFPHQKWVIDAGSLQTITPEILPKGSVVTPNAKEYKMLFGKLTPGQAAEKYDCIVVCKGPETVVATKEKVEIVKGGNPGLTKGGTGDVQAGLTVALLAKNDPFTAAVTAARVVKQAADELYKTRGIYFSADDLSDKIPEVLKEY